jgi:hypothetical protein
MKLTIAMLMVLCLLCTMIACSGSNGTEIVVQPADQGLQLLSVDGSTVPGVRLTRIGNEIRLEFSGIDEGGKFVRIPLPGSLAIAQEHWSNDEELLHLSIVHQQELHIGVCTIAGTSLDSVSVQLLLADAPLRRSSEVPDGDINRLVDLQSDSLGDGTVALSWSEVNRGDYDFNGETNISDITGLARSLEQSYNTADPQAALLTEYWVDGNQNGIVTVSDISVIGQNYGNQVAGYAVNRNGTLLDPDSGGYTVVRADSLRREGLPNLYGTQFAGSVTDSITVIPKDIEGNNGVPSDPPPPVPQFNVDVNIQMDIANTEFYDLDGSGQSGPFAADRFAVAMFDLITLEPLRRLLPGELPESVEIGTSLLNANSAELYDLPTNRPLALGLIYLPTRDLGTLLETDPPSGSPIDSYWSLEPLVNIYPLPMLASKQTQSISVNLSISKLGAFKVIGTSGFTGFDGPLSLPLVQEFDDHFLSRNTENDGFAYPSLFENDARMFDGKPDQASWGVTQNLLWRLALEAGLSQENRVELELVGKIAVEDSFSESEGFINIRIQSMTLDGIPVPAPQLPVEPVLIRFTELSEFALQINGGATTKHISPVELLAEDIVNMTGELQLAAADGGDDLYWMDDLLVHLR